MSEIPRTNRKQRNYVFNKIKKKSNEDDDAAIKYLQGQYENINSEKIQTFRDFPLTQKTQNGLKSCNFILPTEIQKQSIGFALQGKDVLGAAKTGSGKTLAFLVPVLELLFCKKWTRLDGMGALIISPTRELAYQIYHTLRNVGSHHDFSAGLIIGGQNLRFERKRMDQCNILICTPGRLLQHMDENPLFNCDNMQILILDEADRCLDMGFQTTMNAIIENLPGKRQTLLFSATQTKSVKDLARLSLSFPVYVDPHEKSETRTPSSLKQSYIVCEIGDKIPTLWSFIKNHLKQKVIVFFATCKEVKYVYDMFCKLRPGISLLGLYGRLHQEKRETIYNEFCRKSNVVLFATDLASRGLDFPHVNWVIQYDCPEDVDTYIHRVGRTARGYGGKGEGLLFLLPNEEKEMVKELICRKIPINNIRVDQSKLISPQRKLEAILAECPELKESAQRAFVSYAKSIFLMKNKKVFDVQKIDTESYAKSLGLVVPPRIRFLKKFNKAKEKQSGNKHATIETESDLHETAKCKELDNYSDISVEMSPAVTKVRHTTHKTKNNEEFDFNVPIDSDEDDILILKRKDHDLDDDQHGEILVTESKKSKRKKIITREDIAKKLQRKKIKVNSRINFDEEGVVIPDAKRDLRSEVGRQYEIDEIGGIDIEKAKEVLKEEDKYDKEIFRQKIKTKHRERKLKLKNRKKDVGEQKDEFGSEYDLDGVDTSWLPDPDKIYGKSEERSESDNYSYLDDASDNKDENESEVEAIHRPKRQLITKNKNDRSATRRLKKQKMDNGDDGSKSISINEVERLALQLLKGTK